MGAAFISQQTGDWSGSAWASGSPGATDWVTITTGHTVTVDIADAHCYSLAIAPGATLIVPNGHQLTVEGEVQNDGALRQTKSIPGSGDVDFHLRDSEGNVVYYGLLFEALGYTMGATQVDIHGDVIAGTGTLDQTLGRWFDIAPQYPPTNVPAAFYYRADELNGNTSSTLDVYHYRGVGVWDAMHTVSRGGSGAAQWVTAEIGPDFSPFVLKSPDAPTSIAVTMLNAQSGFGLTGLALIIVGALLMWRKRRTA